MARVVSVRIFLAACLRLRDGMVSVGVACAAGDGRDWQLTLMGRTLLPLAIDGAVGCHANLRRRMTLSSGLERSCCLGREKRCLFLETRAVNVWGFALCLS